MPSSLCSVNLTVVEASKCAIKDTLTKSSDPYCKISCGFYSSETQVIKKSLNPVWNAVFDITSVQSTDVLLLTCWDKDKIKKDDFLGVVSVRLVDYLDSGVQDLWMELSPRQGKHDRVSGSIHILLEVYSEGSNEEIIDNGFVQNNFHGGVLPIDNNYGGIAPVQNNYGGIAPVQNNSNSVMPISYPETYTPCRTVDPLGYTYYGTPITPLPAYDGQYMPPQYVFQPQTYFYNQPEQVYQPPPFYYGPVQTFTPPAYQPPPVTYETTFIENYDMIEYHPQPEIDMDFHSKGHKSTDVIGYLPSEVNVFYVSHINLFDNSVKKIEGLYNFPNLMRLTLRHNNLRQLEGINQAPYLRWVDVSSNKLKNFQGCGEMPALEWLDAHYNDMKNLNGFHFAPNLTWLNVNENDLTSFSGCEYFHNLRWIDASTNDLKSVRGLELCTNLQTIDVSNNDLADVHSVLALSNLPYLSSLDIYWNDFSDRQIRDIKNHFARTRPDCYVITTKKEHLAWKYADCNWV